MTATLRDVRVATNSLSRSPGFTVIAIVTLALGIGANTSMFSILNSYLLQPPAYEDHQRVDRIYRATAQNPQGGISPADYLDLKPQAAGYGEIAAYTGWDASLSEQDRPAETAAGVRVSANILTVLRARPMLGRSFRPEEEAAGRHRVLILGHRYWQLRFGSDESVVGRTVRVDGEPHEIVGVMPATFSDWRHLGGVDVFRPLGLDETEARERSATWLRLVGRRSQGLTADEATAFIVSVGSRLATDHPAANTGSTWRRVPIGDTFLAGNGLQTIAMLIGLSGLVLLIACSNLANLLLARTMARAREFAVRSALGASRMQVLRPLFVESLLLALAGGVGAIFVALWTFDWFAVHSAGDNGVGVDFKLDWLVLAWAFGACLFTALAFGLVPALFAQRLDPIIALKSGARGNTGGREHQRFRNLLIVGQFALATVLLAGAALFVGGLHELNNRRHGWESDNLVTATVALPKTTYATDEEVAQFQRLAVDRLEALPGVSSASLSFAMPFFGLGEPRKYLVAGRETPPPGHEPAALINGVSPHYFETVGTRVLRGRAFDGRDTRGAARVFVINESMARGLFPDQDAIGQRLARAGVEPLEWGEVVGVVADIQGVAPDPSPIAYQLYQPLAQEPRRRAEIAVRTSGVDGAALVGSIRTAIATVDPDLPLRKLQPANATIARANYQLGVLSSVLSALALLGLGLASLGVYGVIARTVAQRTGEFGIRLALGAQARDITRLVLTSGAKLAIVGSALGLLGAFGVERLLAMGFPAMRTNSVAVMIGVTVLLSVVAQIAAYLPARHASRISPTEALRAE